MTGNKFERTSPEAVGISSRSIEELIKNLERVTEMHGIMVMRHEKICAEGWWAPYAPGIRHSLHSLSKTYSATAVGIAVTEGKIALDEKIISIFPDQAPENPDENLKQLTVKDILCMGSGMENLPEVTENWIAAYLSVPIRHRPGSAFYYNSVGSTLLCAIVERKTGIPVEEYLKNRLFDKIGIDSDNLLFERMPDGTVFGGGGFYATTEDNLRLMKLYKDGGVWNGDRILSEEYVKMAISRQIDTASESEGNPEATDNFLGYGFQIWQCQPEHVYRADGAMGQFSIVFPDQDMIISVNETASNAHWAQNTLNEIWKFAAGICEGVLPENEEEYAHLKDTLAHLSIEAPSRACARNKEMEFELEGKTYVVTEGRIGFETEIVNSHAGQKPIEGITEFTLKFEPGTCCMRFCQQGQEHEVLIATDGSWRWNRLKLEGRANRELCLSGYWESDCCFTIRARWVETCYENELKFEFHQDQIQMSKCNKVGRYMTAKALTACARRTR